MPSLLRDAAQGLFKVCYSTHGYTTAFRVLVTFSNGLCSMKQLRARNVEIDNNIDPTSDHD
jgi:hypothetical protein